MTLIINKSGRSIILSLIGLLVTFANVYSQCQYSLKMVDSYGDSWNGGRVTVYLDGIAVLVDETITMSDNGGDWKTVDFTVTTGGEVTTDYTAGSWSGENEYYIYDGSGGAGNLLYSSGVSGNTPGDLGSGFVIGNCPTCPSPSALGATNIIHNATDIFWTENGVATLWDVEIGTSGFVPSGIPTTSGLTSPSYSLTGLTPNTSYDFYIRSDCGSGDQSNWVGPYNFTTTILTGQVFVSATSGTSSGIYSTMKTTFDKINDGTHQGIITITVGSNDGETILETSEAILNKSGTGGASYSSVQISPGSTNIKIQGSISGSCCVPAGVIKLNQAENIFIDGRFGGAGNSKHLTIENTNIGSYSSSFVFFAASNNELKYCTVKSSVTGSCCGAGTISITDNNIGGGNGSSNNLIAYCDITKSGSSLPRRAIFAKGANGRENNSNVIRECRIFDFEEFGVFLGNSSSSEGYNRDWTIEGNEIFQSSPLIGMTKSQAGICIGYPYTSGSSGRDEEGHFIVRNNWIGGNGSGGDWEWSTTSSNYFFGIFINDGTDAHAPSEIYSNRVSDIILTTGNTSSSSSKPIFSGIAAYNCKINIGSKGGNVVGSLSDNSSFEFSKTTSGGYAAGIFVYSSSDLGNVINNNIISGISNTGGSSALTVFTGLYNASATTYPADSIFNNNVSYLIFRKTNYVNGIYGQGLISANRVRDVDFLGSASFSELVGISWGGGEVTSSDSRGVENNEVILGKNRSGNDIAQNDIVWGIEVRRGDADVHYNSVLIEGNHTGSENSYAIELPNTGTVNFHNNLLYNERSGGSGKHFAIYKSGPGTAFNASNNAYVTGLGANNYLGSWSGVDQLTLSNWESVSGEISSLSDDNSNAPPSAVFPLLNQDSLDVPDPTWLQSGVSLTNPNYDIKGSMRDFILPTIGAYEKSLSIPLAVDLVSFYGESEKERNMLIWTTASEQNNNKFIIERSQDGETWEYVFEREGAGTTSFQNYYSGEDFEFYRETFYRLIQIDNSGVEKVKGHVFLKNHEFELENLVFPNPANDVINLDLSDLTGNVEILINSSTGALIYNKNLRCKKMNSLIERIDVQGWSDGVYLLSIKTDLKFKTCKIMISK